MILPICFICELNNHEVKFLVLNAKISDRRVGEKTKP